MVRRALTMLLDREAIVREVRMGSDSVAASWFYPGSKEYNADITPWPFDPNQAAQLLDESGWQDHDNDGVRDQHGINFAFTLLYPAGNPIYDDLSDVIRTSLARAHIQVEAQAVPWSVYTERLGRGSFDACLSLWHMVPRSDPFLVWHSTATGTAGFNFIGFADAETDQILEQARTTGDPVGRSGLYHRFSEVLHRNEPYSMLFHRYNLSLVSKHFGGIYSTPYGILRYEDFLRSLKPREKFMRIIQCIAIAATSGLVIVGCGSSPGSVSGSVAGKSVSVHSAAFANVAAPSVLAETGITTVSVIVMSDSTDACGDITGGKLQPNKSYLVMGLGALSSPSSPTANTYNAINPGSPSTGGSALLSGLFAVATLQVDDAQCNNELTSAQAVAQTGTITLNSISAKSGGEASGSFSLKVGSQSDTLSGSFNAKYCAGVSTFVAANETFLQGATTSTAAAAPCQ